MNKKKILEPCALCKKQAELTYEHIPPHGAFNWMPEKPVFRDDIVESFNSERLPWDLSGLRYKNQQRGAGGYFLCKQCNNDTGKWYGEEYIRFVYGLHFLLQKEKPLSGMTMAINCFKFRPLLVLKQIISMFCSINQKGHPNELNDFVLNKESMCFDKKRFKVCVYLYGGGLRKYVPIQVQGNITNKTHFTVVSEIITYPIGLILYIDPLPNEAQKGLDITSFCDYEYDQEVKFEMGLPIYESNTTVMACDYRTKDEILVIQEQNLRRNEEYGE